MTASRIDSEAVPAGLMTGRETAILLYGALEALCWLLNPPHAAGGRRVLDAAARSLWPEPPAGDEERPEPADDDASLEAELRHLRAQIGAYARWAGEPDRVAATAPGRAASAAALDRTLVERFALDPSAPDFAARLKDARSEHFASLARGRAEGAES